MTNASFEIIVNLPVRKIPTADRTENARDSDRKNERTEKNFFRNYEGNINITSRITSRSGWIWEPVFFERTSAKNVHSVKNRTSLENVGPAESQTKTGGFFEQA